MEVIFLGCINQLCDYYVILGIYTFIHANVSIVSCKISTEEKMIMLLLKELLYG